MCVWYNYCLVFDVCPSHMGQLKNGDLSVSAVPEGADEGVLQKACVCERESSQ